MDRKRIIAMLFLHRRRHRRKTQRIHWVHPTNMQREELGAFYTLFKELREDKVKFYSYFQMSIASFDELHNRLQDTLQRQNTHMRTCIQPVQMLAVALRYLASGSTFSELHRSYRLGISTVSKIVKEVCLSILSIMQLECIPITTKELWETIASNFEKRANFPHCIGAVDGKHVRVSNHSSVVLMVVADSEYRIIHADVGLYGEDRDSKIFKNSSLWTSIVNNEQDIPAGKCLPGSARPIVPYCFLGDEAFGLHEHLLRPFTGSSLTLKKRVFNYRLSRAQRYVECTFGILSNKWKIFHRPLKNVDPDFAVEIVKTCVILHNFVLNRDGYHIEDTMSISGFEDVPAEDHIHGGMIANIIRNALSDYFLSDDGAVSWQLSKV